MNSVSAYTNIQVSEKTANSVISNLQLLLKLSPYWDLKSLLPMIELSAQSSHKFEAIIKYYHEDFPKTLNIEAEQLQERKSFAYKMNGEGIQKTVEISLVNNPDGSIGVTQKYYFDTSDSALIESLSVELKYWHKAIIEYIKLQNGSGIWKRCFRWFMDRIWLNLSLSERKIAIIIIKISIIEIIVLVVFIFAWRLVKA